jgi:phosphoenolpyruvate carboxykinase (ATP)
MASSCRTRSPKTGATCWLVNTGWTGGAFGTGKRMPIKATRALLTAALDGSLNNVEFRKDPNFGFEVPVSVPGVDDKLLDPRQTWADPAAYDAQAQKLVSMFSDNFAQYADKIDDRGARRRHRLRRWDMAGRWPAQRSALSLWVISPP